MANLEVALYPKDETDNTVVERLTGRVSGLSFTTQIHGGFGQCWLRLACSLDQAWQWWTQRFYWRILITEGIFVVWEGRIEDIALREGGVDIHALGYWANCYDEPYMNNLATTPTAYTRNEQGDVTIKHALTNHCSQISSDQTNIDSTGFALGSIEYSDDDTPAEVIASIASLSSNDNGVWDFTIYDNRVPHFHKRNPTAVDWMVRLKDLERGWKLERSTAELYNRIYAIYTSAGAKTRTATASNAGSSTKYRSRTRFITLGTVVSGTATSARDRALTLKKDPQHNTGFTITRVFDRQKGRRGVKRGLWRVRAGQSIRIEDLVPLTSDLDTITLDGLRTFWVKETRYDADLDRLTIVPDRPQRALDALLARSEITGQTE